MGIENGKIHSIREAVMIIRQAIRDGRDIPVAPCARPDSTGRIITCPKLDLKAGNCTDSDGPLPSNGGLECPLQKGRLVLRINDKPL